MTQTTVIWALENPVSGNMFVTRDRDMVSNPKHLSFHWTVGGVVLTVAAEVMAGVNAARITIRETEFKSDL
jgi:hypothetical protein